MHPALGAGEAADSRQRFVRFGSALPAWGWSGGASRAVTVTVTVTVVLSVPQVTS
ncbi:hypothetical protein [Streptomyces jeddahensis]|uniref:hypothetical protein n=1 Tax=Streptomyces jeddahensis TaxID=1716141 RepID=UPI001E419003|nr:hypothetical protein [Streptomyces jeddahensis]